MLGGQGGILLQRCGNWRTSAVFVGTEHTPASARAQTLVGFCQAVSLRLWAQRNLDIHEDRLEIRYQDLDGDTFQVNPTSTVMDLLETYRPEWRTQQSDFMSTTILPADVRHPFLLRLSCHVRRPGVILPYSPCTTSYSAEKWVSQLPSCTKLTYFMSSPVWYFLRTQFLSLSMTSCYSNLLPEGRTGCYLFHDRFPG